MNEKGSQIGHMSGQSGFPLGPGLDVRRYHGIVLDPFLETPAAVARRSASSSLLPSLHKRAVRAPFLKSPENGASASLLHESLLQRPLPLSCVPGALHDYARCTVSA